MGAASSRSAVEREFERIATLVNRDLQGYPVLQRKLADEVTTIEEDYKKCGEVPPPPPDWVEAVDAVGKIKSGSGELATSILEGINQSINRIHDKALAEYRKSYEARHAILEKFMPCWRAIEKTLGQVDKNISGLLNSASSVDNLMAQYEQIVAKTDKAVHALTVSAITQFGIALRRDDGRDRRHLHQLQAASRCRCPRWWARPTTSPPRCAPRRWRRW
mgnify:CR=1 FL=1